MTLPSPAIQSTDRIAQLDVKHSISPSEAVVFDLHLPGRENRWADYIYDRETGAFHALRNRSLGFGTQTDLDRQVQELQDKDRSSRRLAQLGILTPRTYLASEPGQDIDLMSLCVDHGPLFCKPRRGSRGLGAFRVEQGTQGIQVLELQASKAEQFPIQYAADKFATRPYLVQELLVSHSSLAVTPQGLATDVVTVRLITHSPAVAGDRVYCAVLEAPHEKTTSDGLLFFDITALDPKSGIPLHRVSSRAVSSSEPEIRDRRPIPDWNLLLESGIRAHEQYPSIYAIAWDFALTGRGPVLLEGNAGWSVEVPQLINGPLLDRDQHLLRHNGPSGCHSSSSIQRWSRQ